MARLRSNFQRGSLSANAGSGDTSLSSGQFSALPVVASPDYLMIVLDPDAVHGNPEIVKVTTHTSSATSVTVTRAQESTSARSHNSSTTWRHVPTKQDWIGVVNGVAKAKEFGCTADGTTDDIIAITNAITSLTTTTGGSTASGGTVELPAGTIIVSSPIVLPNGVRLLGAGTESTFVKAKATFSGSAIVKNSAVDGTQQDAYVENLTVHGNSVAGPVDGILFDSMFVNTYIRNVKVRSCTGYGIHWKTSAVVSFAPGVMDTVECDHNGLDQILIEGSFYGIGLYNLDVEHFTAGYHGLHLKGVANAAGGAHSVNVYNTYSENGVANAASIFIESVSNVVIDGLIVGDTQQSGQAAVRRTGTNQWSGATGAPGDGSKSLQVSNVYCIRNTGFVIIDDQTTGYKEVTQTTPGGLLVPYNSEFFNAALIGDQPADHSFLAWAFPPEQAIAGASNTLGFMVLTKVKVPATISVTNIVVGVSTAGASLTSSQCFAGIYDSGGTRLGVTADQSGVWNSTGLKTMAISGGPITVTGGPGVFVWVALLANGSSTVPAFASLSMNGNALLYTGGLTVSTALAAYQGGGLTSLASSITPSSNNFYSNRTWAALS